MRQEQQQDIITQGELTTFTDADIEGRLRVAYRYAMKFKRRREALPADLAGGIQRLEAEQARRKTESEAR
jgi:hypothetical protein